MFSYLIRRLLLMLPTLLGITVVVYVAMAATPGGIGATLIGRDSNIDPRVRKAMEEYLNKRYGLNRPAYERYFIWLNKVSPIGVKERGSGFPASWSFGFKSPDLGESFIKRRAVLDMIGESLPVTLLLNCISFPIIYGLAIWSGIRAGAGRGKTFDRVSGTVFLGLWSFPTILAGTLAIGFLASDRYLRWFPTNGLTDIFADDMRFLPSFGSSGFERGYLLDVVWHLVLPVLCLSYGSFAVLSKLARGAILENINMDYARTARAKGLSEKVVLYRHVLRNSLLPLITVASGILPAMLSGALIVETIFGLPGMGRLAVEAVQQKDPELVLSITLLSGLLGLIGYLLADIGYAIADPRVSYER
jgi:ABC-type dipeptide/oligopeptide/nickel transport system permease component